MHKHARQEESDTKASSKESNAHAPPWARDVKISQETKSKEGSHGQCVRGSQCEYHA